VDRRLKSLNRYFEDFEVEDTFRSAGRTVTEADIVAFAGLSGDYTPLHVDEVHAAQSLFAGRVAHGLLH
jgi:acyl dehydratase